MTDEGDGYPWGRIRVAVEAVVVVALVSALAGVAYRHQDGPTDSIATRRLVDGARGSFVFDGAAAVAEHPVRTWFLAPEGDASTARILVVIPGAQRNAEDYRDDWDDLVTGHDVIVLVPELLREDYTDEQYNLANLLDRDGEVTASDATTFAAVDALVARVAEDVGAHITRYDLFGHSAGAQFVHRMVEYDGGRIDRAVAANAGWYTVPDPDLPFPYGLDGGPDDEVANGDAFARDLVVLLGADDIDPEDDYLRHDEGSDRQGNTRLERGLTFYREARLAAAALDADFAWRLDVVPGVAHNHTEMAAAAAALLFASGD